uniref:Zinc finger and BTB domain containing 21 n=1 Tax=Scophthalmus maximus TaxID=52904 RepID=A0A8D3DLK1_SCOMX
MISLALLFADTNIHYRAKALASYCSMESLVHYSNPSHTLSVLGVLNEQRLRGQMCDVVLVVADQKYQAHKSVLAASSEYFQSLFTRMDAELLNVVNLDFCEPDAFEIVLNYIYSSSLFVDKGSLAVIQELGYSLGIPFLTNIVSARPHASYCVSRKRLSFSEGDENDVQTRSVIVCRVRNDTTHPSRSNYQRKTSERSLSPHSTRESAQPPSEHNSHESVRNSESRKSSEQREAAERKFTYPYTSILKGNSSHITSVRPQLTSSVSFSDAEIQHIRMQSGTDSVTKEENEEQHYHTKVPFEGQASEPSQTIDRSGPLIKSLLRRSLSMDSPVPVFSPTLELKELQNREQSVVKMASKASGPETSAQNGKSKKASPLVLRPKYPSGYDEETQVEREVSVKVEPSSPLADPMDIIRITVGDALPVNFKDLQTNYDHGSRTNLNPLGKRKDRPDNRRYPFKKKHWGAVSEQDFQMNTDTGDYSCRLCNMKLSSLFEQGDHERGCRHTTVCPYCGLRFSSPTVKRDHEAHCKYKKLTCLECMRTFKSSFSIWRHQVEVHNLNMMTAKDQIHLRQQENNEEASEILREEHYSDEPLATGSSRDNISYSDSSGPHMYDSEDSSSYVPEDLSMGHLGKLVVKEEPLEEAVSEMENTETAKSGSEEPGVWPCEKCGNLFSSCKDLERHQELLCHIKPFICHICNKAFRTNFRLWSHFQSHMSTAYEPGAKEIDRHPSPLSPEPCSSSASKAKRPELERQPSSHSPLSKSDSMENTGGPQESDTLFYHAPSLSALTFKRQYMCKLCHRTFKTAFSLWSHEQSHNHM